MLCVCDREECGWAWLVGVSKGEPKRCSHCKRGNWNKGKGVGVKGMTAAGVRVSELGHYSDGEIREALKERGEVSDEVVAAVHLSESGEYPAEGVLEAAVARLGEGNEAPRKEEIRESLRGMIRHMEENGPQNAPAVDPGPPNKRVVCKRVVCKYWEYDEQEGEHYRCGSDEGHRGKHTRGEKMVGEGRRKGCAEHGDKWCMECG